MNFLIVDDDPITCKQIAGYIELLGENDQISIASDGPEALRELTNHSFDVVFLDLNLPQLDGKSILETITDKLSVIIISASTDFAAESYNYNVVDSSSNPSPFLAFPKQSLKSRSWGFKRIKEQKRRARSSSETKELLSASTSPT